MTKLFCKGKEIILDNDIYSGKDRFDYLENETDEDTKVLNNIEDTIKIKKINLDLENTKIFNNGEFKNE